MNEKGPQCYFLSTTVLINIQLVPRACRQVAAQTHGRCKRCVTCRIGTPKSAAARLTLHRRSPNHDEIDGSAGPVVVEDSDRQPSRPPRERVEVGAAFVRQRPVDEVGCAVACEPVFSAIPCYQGI